MSRRLKYLKLSLFVFTILTESSAQTLDSVRRLKEVIIASTRMDIHSIGYRVEKVDSVGLIGSIASNLTELLTRNANVHVRSYGVNGLSSPNLRGTGSSHTAILWNGVNLQSPSSGQLDIALLPTTFVNDVSVQFGGAASLFGAGAIGGAIHLNNRPSFNDGLILQMEQNIGSFGRHHQSYTLGWSNNNFNSSLKYFRFSAENDFKFVNETLIDSPTQRRAHNEFSQQGLLLQNYWKWNENNQISFRFWIQDNTLEVPTPITVAADGNAEQDDSFNRSLLTWEHQGKSYTSTFRSALINHQTDFNDTLSNIVSSVTYHSFVNEYELNKSFATKTELNIGVNNTHEWVESINHGQENPTRNRISIFAAAKQSLGEKLLLNLRVREELIDGDPTAFIPSLGIEYFFNKELQVKGSFSRNYLIPTFNQLYWTGAGAFGNSSLKSELSWSEEIGIVWHSELSGDINFNAELTAFSNQVDNWIIWAPVINERPNGNSNQGWTPSNIKNVWSRGLETTNSFNVKIDQVKINLKANYSWTKSTNQQVEEAGNPAEIGKQIIYSPEHSGKIGTTLSLRGYRLGWWHHITGRQFTTGDNIEIQALDRFGVSTIVLSRKLNLNSTETRFQFEINNLFNKNYLVRAGYPMPLRNIRLGLTIKI